MQFARCLTVFRGGEAICGWGKIYLRYRTALRLVRRWAVCDAEQGIRVFPASEQGGDNRAFYLMRAADRGLQKRRLRLRGIGREFKSLRDYQRGDELRNISLDRHRASRQAYHSPVHNRTQPASMGCSRRGAPLANGV